MRQFHVLLVEDDAVIRSMLAEALLEASFTVSQASSGTSALRLFDQREAFDLLLTDVHMPGGVNGVTLAQQFRSRWPQLPVVFVTGRPDALLAFGAFGPRDRCVLKPCRCTTLLSAVASSLAA